MLSTSNTCFHLSSAVPLVDKKIDVCAFSTIKSAIIKVTRSTKNDQINNSNYKSRLCHKKS